MEYVNALHKYDAEVSEKNYAFYNACIEDLIRMLAPFAPHFAEELWEIVGNKESVMEESYPIVNEAALMKAETEYAVQVNSKIKAKVMIPEGISDEEIQAIATANADVATAMDGKAVKKCIIVKGRLVNLIVG
jgi:leucyl-tRNA synthetase